MKRSKEPKAGKDPGNETANSKSNLLSNLYAQTMAFKCELSKFAESFERRVDKFLADDPHIDKRETDALMRSLSRCADLLDQIAHRISSDADAIPELITGSDDPPPSSLH